MRVKNIPSDVQYEIYKYCPDKKIYNTVMKVLLSLYLITNFCQLLFVYKIKHIKKGLDIYNEQNIILNV